METSFLNKEQLNLGTMGRMTGILLLAQGGRIHTAWLRAIYQSWKVRKACIQVPKRARTHAHTHTHTHTHTQGDRQIHWHNMPSYTCMHCIQCQRSMTKHFGEILEELPPSTLLIQPTGSNWTNWPPMSSVAMSLLDTEIEKTWNNMMIWGADCVTVVWIFIEDR